MIPVSDSPRSRVFPFVNYTLIAANLLVFFYELSLGDCTGFTNCALGDFIDRRGVVPDQFARGEPESIFLDPFTSMFIHAGWLHIISNMLFLWVFGDNVEDSMGHVRYLVFYLACGYLASVGHVAANPDDLIPAVGASGAISGVLAAYLVVYPRATVTALIPFFLFIPAQIPAFLMIGLWFFVQLSYGAASLDPATAATEGVAYWAHIGGFVAGLVLVWFFRGPPRKSPYRRAVEDADSWP
ncbi:MAG: rhomboid family intramembrane serine protease [Dehalococcoidia bacterium]|nr:rhomboid family intramembrane serine protease [Dehalococcoidia bacterium]